MEEAESKLRLIANVKKIVSVANQETAPTVPAKQFAAKAPGATQGASAPSDGAIINKNLPFIYGASTCTSCFSHPVIGERFFGEIDGVFLSLCEKCHEDYTGSVELDPVEFGT
jgi:hypothetical protein